MKFKLSGKLVVEELYSLPITNWYKLGLYLGIQEYELQKIKEMDKTQLLKELFPVDDDDSSNEDQSETNEYDSALIDINEYDSALIDINEDDSALLDINEDDSALIDINEDDSALIDINEDDSALLDINEDDSALIDINEDDSALIDNNEDDSAQSDRNEDNWANKIELPLLQQYLMLKRFVIVDKENIYKYISTLKVSEKKESATVLLICSKTYEIHQCKQFISSLETSEQDNFVQLMQQIWLKPVQLVLGLLRVGLKESANSICEKKGV